jgi:putative oxidoreductase
MGPVLGRFAEPIYAMLRIVTGLLFASHGSQALLNFPPAEPHALPPLILVGKVIELVGGILIAVGLQTSIAAFITSGQMAYAYWVYHHAKGGFWPVVNKGELAVLYCFVFLFMAAKGSGAWSVDGLIRRARKP